MKTAKTSKGYKIRPQAPFEDYYKHVTSLLPLDGARKAFAMLFMLNYNNRLLTSISYYEYLQERKFPKMSNYSFVGEEKQVSVVIGSYQVTPREVSVMNKSMLQPLEY